mmetsp:Transcript_94227/g.196667  ORF Transcript_94227/g.196667 Transcript_94227/m.196667 type:complete len:399 (-) Transcript_94227:405-1601(-)
MTGYTFGISENFNGDSIALALCGGALLGASVVVKTSCLSGVLGISNYTKRLIAQPELKRVFFIGGMVIASVVLSYAYAGTETLPVPGSSNSERSELVLRLIAGSFLVGLGASLQHGCTSGHGLTGIARLSPRSWVAVPTFMTVGLVSASLMQSSQALPDQGFDGPDWWVGCVLAAGLAIFLVLVASALWVVGRRGSDKLIQLSLLLGEFVVGATFGSGLLISGMARASKVAAFLDVLSGKWDPTLPFVMGGGVMVTFPYFQAVRWLGFQKKAFLHPEHLDLPPAHRMPDRTLVLGSTLFGFGWAVCGVCPGPIWVNLGANPSREMVIALLSLTAGLCAQDALKTLRNAITDHKPQATSADKEAAVQPSKAANPADFQAGDANPNNQQSEFEEERRVST